MATAGSERGLTLRSPGRFLATADRLIDEHRPSGATDPRAAPPDRRRLDEGRGLPAPDAADRHEAGVGREGRRRGQPHQAVVVRARRRAAPGRPRPARPRRRARGPVEQGLAVLAVGPDLRRHQRDPAQHRRRAPPRPAGKCHADEVRLDRRPARVPRGGVRDLLAKECPPAVVRAAWDAARRRARPRRVGLARRHGRAVGARARGRRRPRARRVLPRAACSRRSGAPPCRTRSWRRRWSRRRSASTCVAAGHHDARRPAPPACSTPTPCSCADGDRLVLRRATSRSERSRPSTGGRRTGDLRADRRPARPSPTSPTPWRCAFDRGRARHRRPARRARAGRCSGSPSTT